MKMPKKPLKIFFDTNAIRHLQHLGLILKFVDLSKKKSWHLFMSEVVLDEVKKRKSPDILKLVRRKDIMLLPKSDLCKALLSSNIQDGELYTINTIYAATDRDKYDYMVLTSDLAAQHFARDLGIHSLDIVGILMLLNETKMLSKKDTIRVLGRLDDQYAIKPEMKRQIISQLV